MHDTTIKQVIEEAKSMIDELTDRAYWEEVEARDDYGCYDKNMEEASRCRNQASVLWKLVRFAEDNMKH